MLDRIKVMELAKQKGYQFLDDLTDADEIIVPDPVAAKAFAELIAAGTQIHTVGDQWIIFDSSDSSGWAYIVTLASKFDRIVSI